MERKKVLIIDDEKNFTQVFKLNLEDLGEYEVWTENNSHRGLTVVREFKPDIIFLDVAMPGLEGPDILNQIKGEGLLKKTAVVFFTATVTPDEVHAQHGFIGGHPFLAKDCSVHEIVNCIKRSLNNLAPVNNF